MRFYDFRANLNVGGSITMLPLPFNCPSTLSVFNELYPFHFQFFNFKMSQHNKKIDSLKRDISSRSFTINPSSKSLEKKPDKRHSNPHSKNLNEFH